ncbi:hypothetical protein L873DRAFT_1190510 [Choiromyces venosus 120613-1]|uniref:Uncharacterized protein n=1 Tax=Choiromyces venosus 120613-1 TaxID=1336337 RepID=A0A3N4JIR2_9PEZI|nr:hypothetical protein L873DRAFT_1190510 [Choiromyces venosus 120613-1]
MRIPPIQPPNQAQKSPHPPKPPFLPPSIKHSTISTHTNKPSINPSPSPRSPNHIDAARNHHSVNTLTITYPLRLTNKPLFITRREKKTTLSSQKNNGKKRELRWYYTNMTNSVSCSLCKSVPGTRQKL